MLLATAANAAGPIVVHRDPGCGCCEQWAAQVRAQFGRQIRMVDDQSRATFQGTRGVPASLSSCHTAVIDGLVFGYVIDYVLFHLPTWSFAVFNLADSFITIGAGLIILDELLHMKKRDA